MNLGKYHPLAPRADDWFWASIGDHWCQSCGEKNPSEIENLSNHMEMGHVVLGSDHDPNCDGSCSYCPVPVAELCGPVTKERFLVCNRCSKRMDTPAFLGEDLVCISCFTSSEVA